MKDEKIMRIIRDYHGPVWAWTLSRPSTSWVWRMLNALGPDGLKFWEPIVSEMAGWRGYPIRRVLKLWAIRDLLDREWPKFEGRSINEIVTLVEKEIGLRVTPKFIYSVFIEMGRTPPQKTPKKSSVQPSKNTG